MSDAAGDRYSASVAYRARFDESDPNGFLRSSAFLRYAQDAAWIHSEQLGFTREWYAERGLWWLVRCAELLLTGEVRMGETVTVTTSIVGYRKVWARRRTDVTHDSGESVAVLLSDWVITDARGAPTRVPEEFVRLFGARVQPFTPGRVVLPLMPAETSATREFAVRPQDLDPMGHVNNAAYVDYIEESLIDAGHADWLLHVPRRYRLEYAAPAEPGLTVTARLWPTVKGFMYRLERADGMDLLRATIDTDASRQEFRDAAEGRLPWLAPRGHSRG